MLKIVLKAYGNIDFGEDPYALVCDPCVFKSKTIEELSSAFRLWLEFNDLGAGNICFVDVINTETNEVIGKLSYNGRFWPKEKE